MSANVERLRFYEREYLRWFDFVAEQAYHIEMRRRMNRALHLWGIVTGLDVKKAAAVPGAPEQYFVSPGLAIDLAGREVINADPFVLDETVLRDNRVQDVGRYSLWIRYTREATTPPEAGYALCDLKDQFTRWRESARIFISTDPAYHGPSPANAPSPTDALSDDPDEDWSLRLGTVDVGKDGAGKLIVQGAWPEGRTYVGVRAQRITAPDAGLVSPPYVKQPITVQDADLLIEQNAAVGQDFKITDLTPQPPPQPLASPGTLKIAGDLAVKGNVYAGTKLFQVDSTTGKWIDLEGYVKAFIPDVKTMVPEIITDTIEVTPIAAAPNGTMTISKSSTLPAVSGASIAVSLAGIEWLSWDDFVIWWFNTSQTTPIRTRVYATSPQRQGTTTTFDFPISWEVGPPSTATNPLLLWVRKLWVSYVITFKP